ncbi:MAG TPA: TraR/DksA C4-type zinc finger protein [Candidatus Paceibacterota bacterium]
MDTQHFKDKLQDELESLENSLHDIASFNKETGEWEAKGEDMETMSPTQDSNEFADQLEEFDEHREELPALQTRWSEVKHALEKINNGTYGTCEVDNEPIGEDRLEANPAARTCKEHM